MEQDPIRIGRRERVDLPDWGILGVSAKIDTGADTCALDVALVEFKDDGTVRFQVVVRVKPTRLTKWVSAPLSRISTVRPSTGVPQDRPVCWTTVRIGDRDFRAEVGLVCRKNMKCRMLIGRTLLERNYLVDVSKKYLVTQNPKHLGGLS